MSRHDWVAKRSKTSFSNSNIAADCCRASEKGCRVERKVVLHFFDDGVKKNCQFRCKMVVPFVVVWRTFTLKWILQKNCTFVLCVVNEDMTWICARTGV
jgi:hypothetical protein